MMAKQTGLQFEVEETVTAEDVPNWARRPRKYEALIDQVEGIQVGQSLPVKFNSVEEAKKAANSVRDHLNRLAAMQRYGGDKAVIPGTLSTRVTPITEGKDSGKARVYFTMDPAGGEPSAIESTPERQSTSKGRRTQKRS